MQKPRFVFLWRTPPPFFAEGGSAAAVFRKWRREACAAAVMAKGAVEESPEAMSFVSSPLFMVILAAAVIGISVGSVFLSAKRYCRNN